MILFTVVVLVAVAVSVVSPYEYGRFDLPNGKRGFIEENKLSKEEIQKIVDVHNDVRSKAGASNMFTMKWDSDLADLAQGYIDHCGVMGTAENLHDNEWLPYGRMAAQNIVGVGLPVTLGNIESAINHWVKEVRLWNNQTALCTKDWYPCGHYQNMVIWSNLFVGCAIGICPNGNNKMVCNYVGNPVVTYLKPAYTYGKSCSDCGPTAKCTKGGLCKCPMQGMNNNYCGKFGNFEIATCKCECESKRYTGTRCQDVNCPTEDYYMCGRKRWEPSKCRGNAAFQESCPYMCGICPENGKLCPVNKDDSIVDYCKNGKFDTKKCKCNCDSDLFTGTRCQDVDFAKCPAKDPSYCGGEDWEASKCGASWCRTTCPYMCGFCKS